MIYILSMESISDIFHDPELGHVKKKKSASYDMEAT